MKRTLRNVVASAVLCVPAAVLAHDYDYVDGGLIDGDGPRGTESDTGVRLSGSMDLNQPIALFGEVVDTADYTHLTGGAMFHTPLDPRLYLNAGAALEWVDETFEDDTGVGLYAGLRWQALPNPRRLEIGPEIRHLYVFDGPSTSLRNNVLYRLTQNLDLQGALQVGDEDRWELGMRYNFQPGETHPLTR